MFYAVPTAKVIFTAKTSWDVFSHSREHVWTFSVLGDRIYEKRCPFGRPVMFRGLSFIVNTMQTGTTTIFNVFGMTGPSSNREPVCLFVGLV